MATHISNYLHAIAEMDAGSVVTIDGVSWEDYEHLLEDLGDGSAVRISYDHGKLEIMSPTFKHEKYKEVISDIARAIAVEGGFDLEKAGSTTFKMGRLGQGVEPDLSFYVQNAAALRNKSTIDLAIDPPPDVVVEIDVSHESNSKFSIYSGLGVPEIWLYDEIKLRIFVLENNVYQETQSSLAFPILDREILSRFLEQCKVQGQSATLRSFQQWLRTEAKA